MAYSTPKTWVAGEIATAADLNSYLRDNVAWIATDSPCCRVYNSATVTIASGGSGTQATFNSERFDVAGMHSTSSNTGRITIPSGGDGKYLIGSDSTLSANATGSYRLISITLNGTDQLTEASLYFNASAAAGGPLTTVTVLSAGDYVTHGAFQDSGGNRAMGGHPGPGPEFFAFWFRN